MDAQAEIKALITRIENQRATFQLEQDDSEDQHADWENESEEDQGDEPEVIDNSDEINKLDRAINFLEKAVDELDD